MRKSGVTAAKNVDDLTSRLRHPMRWRLRHPLRAAQRQKVAAAVTFVGLVAAYLATQRRPHD